MKLIIGCLPRSCFINQCEKPLPASICPDFVSPVTSLYAIIAFALAPPA